MKEIVRALVALALMYLIVIQFGLIGLLISLPFFFALPFAWHWMKEKWRRRGTLG